MSHFLQDAYGTRIDYLGEDIKTGPQPAFFYFALSGQESLELHPYCQPAKLINDSLSNRKIRVFSLTIPGHEPGLNKFDAMLYWAEQMGKGESILEAFFEKVERAINWLIGQNIVDSDNLAVGGLSRGGFIATHIAARVKFVRTVLGFAPLTDLMQLKEFSDKPTLKNQADRLNLSHLVDQLTHIHNFRFYIGNQDTRVSTDACYHFIRLLAEKGHAVHARHQKVELFITHSIGHKGHGTAPQIFEEGTYWVKHLLES